MPDEVQGYVEFSQIKEAQIREDGREVRLTCLGSDGKEFDMLIPADAVDDLVRQLALLRSSPQIKATDEQEPPLYIAADLEAVINPANNALTLKVINREGFKVRVGLYPEQTKRLFELLLREGKFDSVPEQ